MADVLYLAELVVMGAGTGSTTLYYASGNGHVTGPAETPANQFYDARIKQPINLTRNLFSPGKTSGRSQMGYGNLILSNPDGELDPLIEYGFDGQGITIRRGTVGAAYPSGFPVIFSGTMEQAEVQGDTLVVKVRDRQLDLERPLQPLKYAGDNVLPNGLEGVAGDLKDKPKPICLGQVQNVPAVLVNTSKLIYQVNDGPVNSIPAVYDSGARLVGPLTQAVDAGFGTNLPSLLWGLAYGNGLFVAVGAGGTVRTSPDGIVWTGRVSGLSGFTRAAIYANGMFMIGGTDPTGTIGELATSSDGMMWTKQTLPAAWTNDIVHWIAYGNGTWIIGGGNLGRVARSLDNGITWTVVGPTALSGGGLNLYGGIAYSNGVWMVVGASNTISRSTDNGATWAVITAGWDNGRLLASGRGMFLLSANKGGGVDKFYTSVDGLLWTQASQNPSPYSSTGTGLGFANGQFLFTGASAVYGSPDGVVWGNLLTSTASETWYACAYASDVGLYVAQGRNSGNTAGVHRIGAPLPLYASTDEILNDVNVPPPGYYGVYLNGGLLRLGSPPAGQVTADVTEGASAPMRTAGQLFTKVLQRAGKVGGDWSASDVTALDAALPAVTGFWTADPTTFADTLDLLAATAGGWWGVDATGVYRLKQLLAPSGTPVLSLTANDLLRPLALLPVTDDSRGLPTWRSTLRYSRNYTVQSGTALAGVVADDRRNFLSLQWREARSEMVSVQATHRLAPEVSEESLLLNASDAGTEVLRRQVLRSILRHRYELVLQLNDDTKALDLGDVVSLTHPRYGLSAGALFRIIGIEPDAMARTLTLQVWGPGDPTSLLRLPLLGLSGTGTVRGALVGTGSVALRQPSLIGTGNTPKGLVALRQPALSGTGTVV